MTPGQDGRMPQAGGPPPLRPTGLVLRRDMSFWHEGVQVTHPRLYRAFLRGVDYDGDEGAFVVRLGHFRGQIEVEDTAFWVVAYAPEGGVATLTDQSEEPLDVPSLSVDPDEAVRCRVKGGRFPARFTRAGQSHLLEAVRFDGPEPRVRVGEAWIPAPGLASALGGR